MIGVINRVPVVKQVCSAGGIIERTPVNGSDVLPEVVGAENDEIVIIDDFVVV